MKLGNLPLGMGGCRRCLRCRGDTGFGWTEGYLLSNVVTPSHPSPGGCARQTAMRSR
ncbi:hypothetical protein SRABI118_02510 [Massilia sp. Bi118]|nr:hypothetical protein SRABI118_02510 [Massilia sp. Bi118]